MIGRYLLHCISPILALSGGSQGGEFTSAFGRATEVHGRTASAASEAYDPPPTSVVHCGNGFDARFEAHHSGRKYWTDGIVSGFTLASSSPLKNAFL